MTTTHTPPVSIVGIGCRVPGASGVTEFWRMLLNGNDATAPPPPGRLGTRRGGYLDDVESFDNDWFAISRREAALMDPQQRLALEVAIEALDDAGIGYRTKGSDTAVIVGACTYEHGISVLGRGGHDAPYAVTGSALSIIANRLSYVLDLRGPSLVVDSACSSSLVAVDTAMRLLRDDTVPFAIVGGVNLSLLPHTSDYLAQGGFLAPDGRCKPFDAAADGYTRGDGCSVVILQRTADAQREGNRIYAEIVGSAVGSDGRSNGLYAPNGRAQQHTLRTAWARSGLEPHTSGYIECHGTGTPLGDAVEVGALAAVLAGGDPTWIGSIKSNIGHLEAAAGVTGLIKTALSIQRGVIVPTINSHTENPLLKLADHGLRVPTVPIDWTATPITRRRAGVSSFGFGGTNAHVVLRGVTPIPTTRGEEPPVLIPITGRDIAELRSRAKQWAALLDPAVEPTTPTNHTSEPQPTQPPGPPRTDVLPRYTNATQTSEPGNLTEPISDMNTAFNAAAQSQPNDGIGVAGETDDSFAEYPGPDPFVGDVRGAHAAGEGEPSLRQFGIAASRLMPERIRAAVIARDKEEAAQRLRGLARGETGARVIAAGSVRRRGSVLFLFSGQGGQHSRMGRALAARYPVFARAVTDAADAIVAAGGPRVWTPRNGFALSASAAVTHREATEFVQPAIFAFQMAMTELLSSWGVTPDAVVGHSLGEVAAAAVGGALSLSDAARVIVARSRILADLDGRGAMAALEATQEEAASLVNPVRAMVGIAAVNGPRSVVISGEPRYVDAVVRRAKRRDLFAQRIAVDFAAHSPQVVPLVPEFLETLSDLAPQAPHCPIYSTAHSARTITTPTMDARYWADNASGTVELDAALRRAATDGLSTIVEIAPHPILVPAVREYPAFRDATHAATTRDDEATAFLACLANLHTHGYSITWSANGPFTTAPPTRQWTKHHFPLITPTHPSPPPATPARHPNNHAASNHPDAPTPPDTELATRTELNAGSHPGTGPGVDAGHELTTRTDVDTSSEPANRIGRDAGAGRADTGAGARGASSGWVAGGGTSDGSGVSGRDHTAPWSEGDGGSIVGESAFVSDDLADHVVQGMPTVPAVFWLLGLSRLANTSSAASVVTDFNVHIRSDPAVLPTVTYRRDAMGSGVLAESGNAVVLASARVAGNPTPADIVAWMRTVDTNRAARHQMRVLEADAFYDDLRAGGLEYGPGFRTVRGIQVGSDCAVGTFDFAPLSRAATLDGGLHLLAAARYDDLPPDSVPLPIGIETAWLSTEPHRVVLEVHAFVRRRTRTGLTGDVIGTDQHGAPVFALAGVEVRFVASAQQSDLESDSPITAFRHEIWQPIAVAPTGTSNIGPSSAPVNHPVRVTDSPVSGTTDHYADTQSATTAPGSVQAKRALVIGESPLAIRLTRELDRTLPTERVAREPDLAGPIVSAVLAGRTSASRTAVVLVWPHDAATSNTTPEPDDVLATTARVLDLIQRIQSADATASLTVLLPDHCLPTPAPPGGQRSDTRAMAAIDHSMPMALAGLIRCLQLESGRAIRLVWTDATSDSTRALREIIIEAPLDPSPRACAVPGELRISLGAQMIRRFTTAHPKLSVAQPIDACGTYVVTGGLGALGAVAVRWLLDAGARDVVVLTRSPRPIPALLDGLEDRIVVVRCDAADRDDLANALNDIRECGSTIRGIVHAAGTLEDAAFEAVTGRQLIRMFAPKYLAARNLIELTAADPTGFVVLFSSATGALGAPGQAAYASANTAMDALALTYPDRHITSVGWGVWASGLAETAGGAAHMRRAGVSAFSVARGAELLTQALRYDDPYLLALDYTPTADSSPIGARLRDLLAHTIFPSNGRGIPSIDLDRSDAPTSTRTVPDQDGRPEQLADTIRTVLAATLDSASEYIDPTADFNDLGLSSLLGIEMRRNLETRLGIRISTAELFRHPTVDALTEALADRVAATKSGEVR
ncbi:type I polyketide synthase [Nocardia australiensis]|uniref:type I polyketide synthase n=1 Tax=Nocardia australiensis TaxID=2887191 RepID=UPI001D134BC8|nr:type I polyketide synthase [Nocardia australiensis]